MKSKSIIQVNTTSSKASRVKNSVMNNTGFGQCSTRLMTKGEQRTAKELAKQKKAEEEQRRTSWFYGW